MGNTLSANPAVQAYLQASQAAANDAEVTALENEFNALQQRLTQREQDGEVLEQAELNQYYALRSRMRSHPLIAAREARLQAVKGIFAAVGQILNTDLEVDFATLAEK